MRKEIQVSTLSPIVNESKNVGHNYWQDVGEGEGEVEGASVSPMMVCR